MCFCVGKREIGGKGVKYEGVILMSECLENLRNFDVSKFVDLFGQIIATSQDLTPKGSYGREIPLFQGNLGW